MIVCLLGTPTGGGNLARRRRHRWRSVSFEHNTATMRFRSGARADWIRFYLRRSHDVNTYVATLREASRTLAEPRCKNC